MGGEVTKAMVKAMDKMDLEKVEQTMSQFESQVENPDVHAKTMEGAMGSATTMMTPQDQVDKPISQVAEEAGLEIMDKMAGLDEAKESVGATASGTRSAQ